MSLLSRIAVSILDLLESIVSYDQYWRTGDWWPYPWLPRNQHRPIWLELLALIDIAWCRGTTFALFPIQLRMLPGDGYTHPSHELDFGPADHEVASELNLR